MDALLLIPLAWWAVTVVVVAACQAAAIGDRQLGVETRFGARVAG
jgi:hypothetical protein